MNLSLRKFKIYTAGPYDTIRSDGKEVKLRDENILEARKWGIRLWEDGFSVLTPHLNTIKFDEDCKCDWHDYIEGDLEWISVCDGILLLPNWKLSSGACLELRHAIKQGKPVFEYLFYEDMKRYFTNRLLLIL